MPEPTRRHVVKADVATGAAVAVENSRLLDGAGRAMAAILDPTRVRESADHAAGVPPSRIAAPRVMP